MGRQRFEPKVDRTFDTKADTLERVEVITGVGRRWRSDVKARIVMESLEMGARVSEVARRHGLRPQQLFGWRKQARNVPVANFAPVVVGTAVPTSPFGAAASVASSEIEIIVGTVVIRVRVVADVKALITVLRAVKAAS